MFKKSQPSCSRLSYLSLLSLVQKALMRRPLRVVLTLAGIVIGIFALTAISALGQGLENLITTTFHSDENLRQIIISPGFRSRKDDDKKVVIESQGISPRRQKRLRRAALNRRFLEARFGNKIKKVSEKALEELKELKHVTSVKPILLERYSIDFQSKRVQPDKSITKENQEQGKEALQTSFDQKSTHFCFGVEPTQKGYASRIIAGRALASPQAQEVLIHEYLAYQWGYRKKEELNKLLGKKLHVKLLAKEAQESLEDLELFDLAIALDQLDLSEEERDLLNQLSKRLFQAKPKSASNEPDFQEFTIVGILRGLDDGDTFNLMLDGSASRADIFLPWQHALELYFASPKNKRMGFSRVSLLVDKVEHAQEVEDSLKEEGYSALSIASHFQSVRGNLKIFTLILSALMGVALLVASFGIINTMLTNVLERTREIGLWKALGASNRQVRSLFLLEGFLLGLCGGLLGFTLAALALIPLNHHLKALFEEELFIPIQASVLELPIWSYWAFPLFAAFLAMLAALYPAYRAARVDPIQALRSE